MAAWRRKAIEAFPDLRRSLNDCEFTIYMLYFDLLPMFREALADNDVETKERIYDFAEWWFHQSDRNIYNAVCVAFYEHVFDQPYSHRWQAIINRLTPEVIEACLPLWKPRLTNDEFKQVEKLVAKRQNASN